MTRIRGHRSCSQRPPRLQPLQRRRGPAPIVLLFRKKKHKAKAKAARTPPSNGGLVAASPPEAPSAQESGARPAAGPGRPKPEEGGHPKPEQVASKKKKMQSLVDGSGDTRAHSFVTTSATNNNLQIKCEECGLW